MTRSGANSVMTTWPSLLSKGILDPSITFGWATPDSSRVSLSPAALDDDDFDFFVPERPLLRHRHLSRYSSSSTCMTFCRLALIFCREESRVSTMTSNYGLQDELYFWHEFASSFCIIHSLMTNKTSATTAAVVSLCRHFRSLPSSVTSIPIGFLAFCMKLNLAKELPLFSTFYFLPCLSVCLLK